MATVRAHLRVMRTWRTPERLRGAHIPRFSQGVQETEESLQSFFFFFEKI